MSKKKTASKKSASKSAKVTQEDEPQNVGQPNQETTQAPSENENVPRGTTDNEPQDSPEPSHRRFEYGDMLKAVAEIRENLNHISLMSGHKQVHKYSHSIAELHSGLINTEKTEG
jgi:hypothetical protein